MLHLQETLCLVYRYLAFLCKGEFDSSCIWPWHVFFHKTRSARTFYDRARTLCLLNCAHPCTYPRFVTFSLPRLLVVWDFDDGTFWSPLVCALAYSPQSLCTLVPVWEEKLAKARLGSLDLKDSSHRYPFMCKSSRELCRQLLGLTHILSLGQSHMGSFGIRRIIETHLFTESIMGHCCLHWDFNLLSDLRIEHRDAQFNEYKFSRGSRDTF